MNAARSEKIMTGHRHLLEVFRIKTIFRKSTASDAYRLPIDV